MFLFVVMLACEADIKTTLPYYKDASFTPHWIANNKEKRARFHKVPSFELINQEGDTVNTSTFSNTIYVADFFFTTCPGICPKMTKNMGLIQEAFINDPEVLLLSHSVTPKIDSVEVLKKYAEEKGVISGKWHLVTGDRDEIYALGRSAYFIEEDLGKEKKDSDFIHTENFVLVDYNGHLRGIYNGLNAASVHQLIQDIRVLKKEK